jgi:hypothetical protein
LNKCKNPIFITFRRGIFEYVGLVEEEKQENDLENRQNTENNDEEIDEYYKEISISDIPLEK